MTAQPVYQSSLGPDELHGDLDMDDFGWTVQGSPVAGLQTGDFIIRVNNLLTTPENIEALANDTSDQLTFKFYRPGVSGVQTLTVTRQ